MRLNQSARRTVGKAAGQVKKSGRRLVMWGPESVTGILGYSPNYNRKPSKYLRQRNFQKIILTVMWRINWKRTRVK